MLKVVEHMTETVDMPTLNAVCTTESTGSESRNPTEKARKNTRNAEPNN